MTTIHLPWGKETLDLNLPEGWQVDGIMEPAATQAVSDTSAEVRKALSAPVQSTRLMEQVQAGMRIVLVVDDGSRPTPVPQILPVVIEELLAGGARLEDITLVAALGVHRAMEESELQLRIGAEYGNRLKIVTHDCDDLDKLAFLGTSSRGVPVYINKNVAEADLVVSIGCIEPHIIASFGGGYKNLFPGVAGRLTIAKNHALNCQPDTFNMVGQPIEKNPMRQDLEEAGKMLKPPVFVINAVLNSALQVVKVVAGDPNRCPSRRCCHQCRDLRNKSACPCRRGHNCLSSHGSRLAPGSKSTGEYHPGTSPGRYHADHHPRRRRRGSIRTGKPQTAIKQKDAQVPRAGNNSVGSQNEIKGNGRRRQVLPVLCLAGDAAWQTAGLCTQHSRRNS